MVLKRPASSGPGGARKAGAPSSFQKQAAKLKAETEARKKAERKVKQLEKALKEKEKEKEEEKALRRKLEGELGCERARQQDAIHGGVRARMEAILAPPF